MTEIRLERQLQPKTSSSVSCRFHIDRMTGCFTIIAFLMKSSVLNTCFFIFYFYWQHVSAVNHVFLMVSSDVAGALVAGSDEQSPRTFLSLWLSRRLDILVTDSLHTMTKHAPFLIKILLIIIHTAIYVPCSAFL